MNAAAKTHLIARVVTWEFPRVTIFQPVVRRFHLLTVDDILFEHAIFITNTVATSRQRQRRQRIQETGRQPPQATVAEAWIVLFLQQLAQAHPHLIQCVVNILINAHRQQGVGQRAADQELHRQVIHLTHIL
ncbi:hypothetical protein D3C75_981890 [compost metagenome]